MKIIKFSLLIVFALFSIDFFIGCGGSEEVTEDTTAKDSTKTYQALENARLHYSKALEFNENDDSKSSSEEFEMSINQLSKIDADKLDKHILWKSDFSELTKSVVQDYLTTGKDISSSSKVFKLAKKLNIQYETTENKTTSTSKDFNPEDLPNGDGIKIIKNSAVEEYITYFQGNGRKYMDKWLYRLGKYSNLMRSILRENNAPEELIYLSMIESGLDPAIHSWAGAIGLWQFMPTTGSSYGLYYDAYTDDKCDYEKSTDAAGRHLTDLYKSFGDWYLALAAYNCGPGRVNSAIVKAGKSDFWAARDYLPKETRNYVPQFLACALICIDPKSYGFNDVEYGKPIEYDRIIIKAQLSVSRIADLCNTQVETIRELNPQLLQDVTPVFPDGYLLKIPKGSFKEFSKNFEDAADIEKNDFKPKYDGNESYAMVNTTETSTTYKVTGYTVDDKQKIISKSNRNLIFHKFNEKENLELAAIKYEVRASDIRLWNNYPYGRYPKKGDSLSVWITNDKYKEIYGVNSKNVEIKSVTDTKNSDTDKKVDSSSLNKNENKNDTKDNNSENVDLSTKKKSDNSSVLVNNENKNGSNEKVTKEDTKSDNNEQVENTTTEKKETTKKKEPTTKKESHGKSQTYIVKKGDNLAEISSKYDVTISELKDWNDLSGDKILVGQKLKIYSDSKLKSNDETTSGHKSKDKVSYVVKSGDNLTSIADDFGVTVAQIKEWNELDNDVIYSGQILAIYSAKKTEKSNNTENKKKTTYTVKEGDNLTQIADKFGVTVSEIKDWNELDNDVIYQGQILKLYAEKKTTSKEKEKAKTYTVKSGDNLSSIADKFDITVDQIKEWNELDNDVIYEGQILKLYASLKKEEKKKEKETTKTKTSFHIVKKGETLARIAEKYDVTIADIKKWNKLKSDEIMVGQKLVIKN